MRKRKQDRLRAASTIVWMMSNHMRRLRVGLLPLYQVFLDLTLSKSREYYRGSVSWF